MKSYQQLEDELNVALARAEVLTLECNKHMQEIYRLNTELAGARAEKEVYKDLYEGRKA